MDRNVLVHVDPGGEPILIGRFWAHVRSGRESATFEYEPGWLDRPERFALEPALPLGPGPFHTAPGAPLFGRIGDSAPDRWGRLLMPRAERLPSLSALGMLGAGTMKHTAVWKLSMHCAGSEPGRRPISNSYGSGLSSRC